MTVTEATTQANPSWWSQKMGSGEADPAGSDTGGTDESLGFGDFLDVINPLQHIPVVSTIYRELTGDQISETARMAGGALWGGPVGLIGALANTITEREAGQDIGASALAMMRDDAVSPAGEPDPATALAAAPLEGASPADTPVPASVAQFAAAQPAPETAATAAQNAAQTQSFDGNAANRLDAFIRRANAIRTPADIPVAHAAPSLVAEVPSRRPTPIAPLETATARAAAPEADRTPPAPLRLAANGNTDVAHWMSRALDRYELMKAREQS